MNRECFWLCDQTGRFWSRLDDGKTILHVKQFGETIKAIKENISWKCTWIRMYLNFMTNKEFESGLLKNELHWKQQLCYRCLRIYVYYWKDSGK
jgi:hypothetical protein